MKFWCHQTTKKEVCNYFVHFSRFFPLRLSKIIKQVKCLVSYKTTSQWAFSSYTRQKEHFDNLCENVKKMILKVDSVVSILKVDLLQDEEEPSIVQVFL